MQEELYNDLNSLLIEMSYGVLDGQKHMRVELIDEFEATNHAKEALLGPTNIHKHTDVLKVVDEFLDHLNTVCVDVINSREVEYKVVRDH